MYGEITKAEYFREHAELLSAAARSLKPEDKNRASLLNMSYYFERLAEAAERERTPSRKAAAARA